MFVYALFNASVSDNNFTFPSESSASLTLPQPVFRGVYECPRRGNGEEADFLKELIRGRKYWQVITKSSQAEKHVMRLLICGGSVDRDNKGCF